MLMYPHFIIIHRHPVSNLINEESQSSLRSGVKAIKVFLLHALRFILRMVRMLMLGLPSEDRLINCLAMFSAMIEKAKLELGLIIPSLSPMKRSPGCKLGCQNLSLLLLIKVWISLVSL